MLRSEEAAEEDAPGSLELVKRAAEEVRNYIFEQVFPPKP
jgi:hypothetical protein